MQNKTLKQIALIGATASGKSSLALKLARNFGGIILSLDSLSIYRQINIASAKPSPEELQSVPHFGIDLIEPDAHFDVTRIIDLYQISSDLAQRQHVPLLIVGGSSFYLKILLEGISPLPPVKNETCRQVEELMHSPERAYTYLLQKSPDYANKIAINDRYRIEKGLRILLETGESPLSYFRTHPPIPIVKEFLPIFELTHNPDQLRKRIRHRTQLMLEEGLIDEVAGLEYRYGRAHNPMKAIGIREVLDYLDGQLDYAGMREKIITNTARLAKRQRTFNRSQFASVHRGDAVSLEKKIVEFFSRP